MYTSRNSKTLGLHRIFVESLITSSTSRIFSAICLLKALEKGEMSLILRLVQSQWQLRLHLVHLPNIDHLVQTAKVNSNWLIAANSSSFSLTNAMVSVVTLRQTARALDSESSLVRSTQFRSTPNPCDTNSVMCCKSSLLCMVLI